MNLNKLAHTVRKFAEERNWNQFHSPKNLSMALAGESGELLELFQWLKEEESFRENMDEKTYEKVKEELADIFIYLVRIADRLDIDLEEVAYRKIEINKAKYPVSLSKDNAVKYNRRDE